MPSDNFRWMETSDDKVREQAVAEQLEKAWDCKMVAMPNRHWFDYCAMRNDRIVAYVEIKTRTNPHDAFPTYMISSQKMTSGLTAASFLKIKFLLVVQFADALMFVDVPTAKFHLETADRKDADCIEVVLQIQMDDFKKIDLEKGNDNV